MCACMCVVCVCMHVYISVSADMLKCYVCMFISSKLDTECAQLKYQLTLTCDPVTLAC